MKFPKLKIGDVITIRGIRRRKDGTFTRRCKLGNETKLTITNEYTAKGTIKPAILK